MRCQKVPLFPAPKSAPSAMNAHHTESGIRASMALIFLALCLSASPVQCQMTDADKNTTLNFLNQLRRSVVPPAADMNGLLWDVNLESLAQKAANSCVFAHNYGGLYTSLGEVLYLGGRQNFTEILIFMFLEREIYNMNDGSCTVGAGKYPFYSTCGHYLQIATASVNKVGCGIQYCSGNYLAACEFDREWASPPYQVGVAGSKCGNGYATYLKDELCYSILVGRTPPIPGPFDCSLTCQNYGTLSKTPFCSCTCPAGFYGVRCETKNPYYASPIPNDCIAQAVTCKNGGTPTMSGDKCGCVCPANYGGNNCEVNKTQVTFSMAIYFGGEMRYQSYYPVAISSWSNTTMKQSTQSHLTDAINSYCAVNFSTCCPGSTATALPSTIEYFATCEDFHVTDNYPVRVLDGSLRVDVYYTMQDNVASVCNGKTQSYISRSVLLAAWPTAAPLINKSLSGTGIQIIKAE